MVSVYDSGATLLVKRMHSLRKFKVYINFMLNEEINNFFIQVKGAYVNITTWVCLHTVH